MTYQGSSQPPRPPIDGRKVGIVEGWELRHVEKQQANSGAWKGLFFVIGLLALLVVGGWVVARPALGPVLTDTFIDNPGIVRILLADILAAEFADRTRAPAGTSDEPVKFVVARGQSIDEIRANLVAEGLVTDEVAFTYEIVKDDKDQLIVAGQYTMTPLLSPIQIVDRLAGDPDPPTPKTVLALRPGLRLEQIVAYLQQQKEAIDGFEMDVKAFRDLARNPSKAIIGDYAMLKKIPDGNSLEGFLASGTHEVDIDIEAEDLLRKLLDEWEDTNGDLIAAARRAKVPFYQALTIASIVERETPLDRERPRVAGVYWNRIDTKVGRPTGGLMQADPTVVYAADTRALESMPLRQWDEYLFWDTLGVQLVTVDVPNRLQSFQTYQHKGLPDWPITTPTRKSLEAAIRPNTKRGFLFIVSCPGEQNHTFSKTQAKHNRNVLKCGLPV